MPRKTPTTTGNLSKKQSKKKRQASQARNTALKEQKTQCTQLNVRKLANPSPSTQGLFNATSHQASHSRLTLGKKRLNSNSHRYQTCCGACIPLNDHSSSRKIKAWSSTRIHSTSQWSKNIINISKNRLPQRRECLLNIIVKMVTGQRKLSIVTAATQLWRNVTIVSSKRLHHSHKYRLASQLRCTHAAELPWYRTNASAALQATPDQIKLSSANSHTHPKQQ